jgi:hypothetical protein
MCRQLSQCDDGSFLTVTGFNRSAFTALEAVVFPEDRTATTVLAEKRGRPEILDNKGKLGFKYSWRRFWVVFFPKFFLWMRFRLFYSWRVKQPRLFYVTEKLSSL